ncbi:MAG: phosphatase PAP2 family protein [Sediminibacterium sp.]
MQLQLNRNATIGISVSLITGTCLILLSMIMGKENAFLLMNLDLGPAADFFFYIWANAGDGFIWIPAFALTLMYKKKFLPFLLATIVCSTIITQSSKQIFFKSENRPTAVISDNSLIHKVSGIVIHTSNSFPSGHTATAFSLFLFCCFISSKKWMVPVGFAYALLGGYARIYAAQHFPIDVGAGILVAYCSTLIAWIIHLNYFNKPE